MNKFIEIIQEVVRHGIEVTLSERNEELIADLNFQAKSHGYLVERDGRLVLLMR